MYFKTYSARFKTLRCSAAQHFRSNYGPLSNADVQYVSSNKSNRMNKLLYNFYYY